jgi:hypothetical protein
MEDLRLKPARPVALPLALGQLAHKRAELGGRLERRTHLAPVHKQDRDRNVISQAALPLQTPTHQTPTHNHPMMRRLTPDFSQIGFATLICCAILVAGFVYVLGLHARNHHRAAT